MKKELEEIIKQALKNLGIEAGNVVLEHPAEIKNGDYSTNVALACAKVAGQNPKVLAEKIVAELLKNKSNEIEKIEIAGPGFINFYLSKEFFTNSIKEICEEKETFGKTKMFAGQTWAIEYASPNPNTMPSMRLALKPSTLKHFKWI